MSEFRTREHAYDEKGRLNKFFAEAIVIPKNEGYVEGIPDTPSYISEEYMLASKIEELNGGFQLKLLYFLEDINFPSRPYVEWRIRDSEQNEDSTQSISELASNQAFLSYSKVYWIAGYLLKSRIGLKIYELHEQGWQSIFDYERHTDLTHIGMNNQPVSSGGEVKQFFATKGEWTKQAESIPLLFRCSPASYRITNDKGSICIENEFINGVEDFKLSDRKLSSADSPFNESSTNFGYGAFEMEAPTVNWTQYGGVGTKLLLFAPYIKRHNPQSFGSEDQRDLGSIDAGDVIWEGYPAEEDDFQKIGNGCFAKTEEATVSEDPVSEQEPGLKLDGEKKVTIIGFYKPEVHWTDLPSYYYGDGHPFCANPCGLHPSGFSKALYTQTGGLYSPYGPQYYQVTDATQNRSNIGIDFQDYPSFITAGAAEAYDITQAPYTGQYTNNTGYYRVLFNSSSNTGIIGGSDDETDTYYSTPTGYNLNTNYLVGGSWLGRFDLELWEQVRNLAPAGEICFLNDLLRIAHDQAIFGARRFLVRGSAESTHPLAAVNVFESAAWPFERVRFSKIFRCAHDSSQFTPWLGQRNNATMNNGAGDIHGWINNSVNGDDGLEGFPFLQFFKRSPVSGLMTCLITDMVAPEYPTGTGPWDKLSGSIPNGSYYNYKRTAVVPSLCVVLRTKFDGSGVVDQGWQQLQSIHSYDPNTDDPQTESPEIDNVYQVMQLTSLPYQKLDVTGVGEDKHFNTWHMYVASLDLENQRAYIGTAPVKQYDLSDLVSTMDDPTGWETELAQFILGLDYSNAVNTYFGGPDRGIHASVYNYATEYTFSTCSPQNHPNVGDHRRRLLIASSTAVTNGLCIHAPTGPSESEEISSPDENGNVMESIPILDPKYNYNANAPEQLDAANNRIADATSTAEFNILGDAYNVTTFNSLGSCRNGHDNMVFKGKIGEHLIIPGLYTNSTGNSGSVKITDLIKELNVGQVPCKNWQDIEPDHKSASCAINAIRLHKQEIVDNYGNLKPNVCPANFKVLGPQPHYDLDAGHVKLSENVEIIQFKNTGETTE